MFFGNSFRACPWLWALVAIPRACGLFEGSLRVSEVSTKNEASLNMMRAAFGASFLAKAPKKDLKSQTNHLQPVSERARALALTVQ